MPQSLAPEIPPRVLRMRTMAPLKFAEPQTDPATCLKLALELARCALLKTKSHPPLKCAGLPPKPAMSLKPVTVLLKLALLTRSSLSVPSAVEVLALVMSSSTAKAQPRAQQMASKVLPISAMQALTPATPPPTVPETALHAQSLTLQMVNHAKQTISATPTPLAKTMFAKDQLSHAIPVSVTLPPALALVLLEKLTRGQLVEVCFFSLNSLLIILIGYFSFEVWQWSCGIWRAMRL